MMQRQFLSDADKRAFMMSENPDFYGMGQQQQQQQPDFEFVNAQEYKKLLNNKEKTYFKLYFAFEDERLNEIQKFTFDQDISNFNDFERMIHQHANEKLAENKRFRIFSEDSEFVNKIAFQDDEKDWILISGQEDFEEALKSWENSPVIRKVQVKFLKQVAAVPKRESMKQEIPVPQQKPVEQQKPAMPLFISGLPKPQEQPAMQPAEPKADMYKFGSQQKPWAPQQQQQQAQPQVQPSPAWNPHQQPAQPSFLNQQQQQPQPSFLSQQQQPPKPTFNFMNQQSMQQQPQQQQAQQPPMMNMSAQPQMQGLMFPGSYSNPLIPQQQQQQQPQYKPSQQQQLSDAMNPAFKGLDPKKISQVKEFKQSYATDKTDLEIRNFLEKQRWNMEVAVNAFFDSQ